MGAARTGERDRETGLRHSTTDARPRELAHRATDGPTHGETDGEMKPSRPDVLQEDRDRAEGRRRPSPD